MARALAGHGLTNAQYAVLSALEDEPGLSSAELARRSFVTPQTMNQVVGQLAQAGLVERRPHPRHGRILETRLTGRGGSVLADCHRDVVAIEERMLTGLRTPERDRLAAWLRRCAESLSDAAE